MMKRKILFGALSLLLVANAPAPEYDIVIRGGRVLDGAGSPWVRADVAVKDGRVVRIGQVSGKGAKEIDARDRYVSPGFIDMMDQSGSVLLKNGAAENKLRMGVTTVIDLAIENGRTLARGDLARALDTQLASTQADDAATRIGVTFRDRNQRLCRSFEHAETGGIACASGKQWQVERLYGGMAAPGAEYRQAGSPAAQLMAHAQAIMSGEALNTTDEAAAIAERLR